MTSNKASSWPTMMSNPQRTGVAAERLIPPLKLRWKKRFAEAAPLWSSPVIHADTAYFSFASGLSALALADGQLKWNLAEITISGTGAATLADESLYVAGQKGFYRLDRQTGQIQWHYKVRALIENCTPSLVAGSVIGGSVDGFLYALDQNSGELKWKFEAQDWIKFSPSVLNSTVYFGTVNQRKFFALDAQSGELKWRCQLEGALGYNTSAAVSEGRIFIAEQEVGLKALEAETGMTLWTYRTPYGPFTSPCVLDGLVYVASRRLHALDIQTGREVWASQPESGLSNSAPIVSGDYLYIGGGHWSFVYAFNRHTGEKVWEYPTGDMVFSTPALAGGVLLVGCHDGYLYCFE